MYFSIYDRGYGDDLGVKAEGLLGWCKISILYASLPVSNLISSSLMENIPDTFNLSCGPSFIRTARNWRSPCFAW